MKLTLKERALLQKIHLLKLKLKRIRQGKK